MNYRIRILRHSVWLAGMVAILGLTNGAHAQWPQWGGPNRDFTVETTDLAEKWPEAGPKRLWHRTLGTGYSAITVDDGMLFTMYRKAKPNKYEYTVALDAATGKTIWQKQNRAVVPESTADYGKEFTGPNATPLVVGDRLYTVGRNATLHCFNKRDGTIYWKQDLLKDFGAQLQTCGFSSSPIAYGNTIILPLGRAEGDESEGKSLIAFDQESGEVAWRSQTFSIEHSSPILIKFEGQDQLVQCTKSAVIGVDPASGTLLWEYKFPEPEGFQGIFMTPVWNGEDTLYFAARELGCALKLANNEGKTTAELLWSSRKTPLGMGTPVLVGDMLFGGKRSTNMIAPLLGVDLRTGKRLWLERVFPQAVVVSGGGKMVVLDHKGQLGLVTATREGLTVHSQFQVADQYSFTAPTLVGTKLYVRDEKHIMAFDLSSAANGGEG